VPGLVKRFFVIALLLASACKDPVDQAAKKRIFSPEDPPQAVAAASQKLPPEEAADSVAISRRIFGMGAAETTERIGPHTALGTVSWDWNSNGKVVRLKETRELQAGPGGMSGDFIARMSNTNEQGLEVLRVAGKVYARSTYGKDGAGKFRQRLRDRGMAERVRDEISGALRDFDQLFRGRLKLNAQGTSSLEGRTAWKYVVTLAEANAESDSKLPPLAVPKNGADETTKRRQAFYEARTPRTLQGEVYVDAQTSVLLKARLDGRLGVKANDVESELRIVVESSVTNIGKSPVIEAPKEFLPDEDKPDGIAAALTRFGIERKSADGGVPGPGGPGEPDDDAE
jgi:putative transposon-encoded protein